MRAGIAVAALTALALCACDGAIESLRGHDTAVSRPAEVRSSDNTPATPPMTVSDAAPPPPAPDSRLVPFNVDAPRADADASALRCEFPGLSLPPRFAVYAAGAYSGRKLDYQIDQSGHQATQIDVAVSEDALPVVLMLGAYEPTVWNIGWSPRTRIVAVLVSGYHRQAIAGLPSSVPRINSSHDNKGPCGSFYVTEEQLATLNPIARRVFGQPVTRAFIANNGFVAVGNGGTSGLLTDATQPPGGFRDPDAPLAGEAGLRDALAKGLLREARESDLSAWHSAYDAANLRDAPPVSGARPSRVSGGMLHNAYVVVRPMRVPAGLYGAHSATFIVPRGVQRPTGELGHSRIFDWNTMTCAGATCSME